MTTEDVVALGLDRPVAVFEPGQDLALAVSLAGDGTVLRTVHLLDGAVVPVMGVNVGLLGYLTEVEPPGLATALERFFFAGDHEIDTRLMLSTTVRRADGSIEETVRSALNEASLEKQEAGPHGASARPHRRRTVHLVPGGRSHRGHTDGSTAYSLSARGPVVSPRHRAILLTPVSPHMLFDRSLVLDPDEVVEIEVAGHRHVELAMDGQRVATLVEGDTVVVRPADCARTSCVSRRAASTRS